MVQASGRQLGRHRYRALVNNKLSSISSLSSQQRSQQRKTTSSWGLLSMTADCREGSFTSLYHWSSILICGSGYQRDTELPEQAQKWVTVDWSPRCANRGHKSWAWSACCLMRTCQDHRSVLSSEMPLTSWNIGNPEPVKKQNFSVRERVLKIFEESVSCGGIPNLTGWIFKQSANWTYLSSSEWPLEVPCLFTYME